MASAPASAPSASSPGPLKLTDLPAPASTNPEAVAAYLEGIRGQHDGLNSSYRGFMRASALDPSMSAAYLRMVELYVNARQYGTARESYRRALAYRDRLSERDRAICSALEPGLLWDPLDWPESVRRLRALHEASPRDQAVFELLGIVVRVADPSPAGHAEARATFEAAVAADPTFGEGWSDLALLSAEEGRPAEARATGERCMREAPRATRCLETLEDAASEQGDCRAMLSAARRWIAISPDDRWGYFSVASGLAALGDPWDSVEEAVSQAVEHVVPEDREARRQEWATALAVLRGDFPAVDERAQELARVEAMTYQTRDLAIVQRVNAAEERGDAATAASLATAYLRRRGAFALPTFDTDPTPFLLQAQRRGGAMTAVQLRAQVDRWERDWKGRLGGEPSPDLWTVGEARTVDTLDEAAQALASRPPLDRLLPTLAPGAVGRVSRLAGRFDEAEASLSSAAHGCFVLDDPFDVVRASLELGLAREGRGDTAGACTAYRAVLARWGTAKPRSVTADKARERVRALHCPG